MNTKATSLVVLALLVSTSEGLVPEIPGLEKTWQYYDLGNYIGFQGAEVGDFNDNGFPEVWVTAQSGTEVMAMESCGDTLCVIDQLERVEADAITSFGVLGDFGLVYAGDKIFVHDMFTRKIVGSLTGLSEDMRTIGVIDLNEPGFAYSSTDGILMVVYVNETGSISSDNYLDLPTGRAAFGSFTETGLKQLAFQDGSIFQYNSDDDDFAEAGAFAVGIHEGGSDMYGIDTDGDGIDEIITQWSRKLACWSAIDFGLIWTNDASSNFDVSALGDADSDGVIDVLYGDDQWGSVHALDAATGEELLAVSNPDHGVTNIVTVDMDGDGANELAWGSGASSSGEDLWYFADPVTGELVWQSTDLDGPYNVYAFDEVSRRPGFVFSSYESRSGYDGSVVQYCDLRTKAMIWQKELTTGFYDNINSMCFADLRGDGTVLIYADDDRLEFVRARYITLSTTR